MPKAFSMNGIKNFLKVKTQAEVAAAKPGRKRGETMNAGAIISRYYYNKNDDDKKQK